METLPVFPQIAAIMVAVFPLVTIAIFALRRASRRLNEILRTELGLEIADQRTRAQPSPTPQG